MSEQALITLGSLDETGQGMIAQVSPGQPAALLMRSRPPEPLHVQGRGFTGACWAPEGDRLYVCGFNAVYAIDASRWRVLGALHQPCMNDLHHVACRDDQLWVVNTGLERVDRFERHQGRFLSSLSLQPGWLCAARQGGVAPARGGAFEALLTPGWSGQAPTLEPDEDSERHARGLGLPFHRRKVRDFIHPNHLALTPTRAICTLFVSGQLIDLLSHDVIIPAQGVPLHDGVIQDDALWFTDVLGGVYTAQVKPGSAPWPIKRRVDACAQSGRFGWCRGLWVGPTRVAVGITQLRRASRYGWRQDVPLSRSQTGVIWLDRETGQVVDFSPVEDQGRHLKLYSVLPAAKP